MEIASLQFFNAYADIRHTENRLPHWQQKGAVYFLTFRLADAVPRALRTQWELERASWLRAHPQPWTAKIEQEYHHKFSGAIERWLDAGHGSCVLGHPEFGKIVAEALEHFDRQRFVLISSVVMPNHVHCLLIQNDGWPLEKVLHSLKRYTARRINELISRTGVLWQRDFFDRLVRDQNHLANCVRYIRGNPGKARLSLEQYVLYENEIARAIQ